MITIPDPLPLLLTGDEYKDITKSTKTPSALLLSGASMRVRNFCGWHIGPEIVQTDTIDGPGTCVLLLPTLQLTELQSIAQQWQYAAAFGDPIDVGGLEVSRAGMVRNWSGWTARFGGITYTMRHGRSSWDDVKTVLASVIARQMTAPTGLLREQVGAVSLQPSLTAANVAGGIVLLEHEKDALQPFRIPERA